jgi:large-conductance mechanosensitive channel
MDKTSYEKLDPANQIAIDTQVLKLSHFELQNISKEHLARKYNKNKPINVGECIGALMILALVALVVFMPILNINNLQDAVNSMRYDFCKGKNMTYVGSAQGLLSQVTIICSGGTYKLP